MYTKNIDSTYKNTLDNHVMHILIIRRNLPCSTTKCISGGTPYGNVPNNEIPDRVIRGLRLIQLCYMSDMLYQLLLECWQLDLDERPNFSNIIESLTTLRNDMLSAHLSFNLYPGFQYEQFYPDMELAARAAL